MLKLYHIRKPFELVHAVFDHLCHTLPNGDRYYEGFGTPSFGGKNTIDPLIISAQFLETCEEVSREQAAIIHPELVSFVARHNVVREFYTKILAKDVEPGMEIVIGQSWQKVVTVFPPSAEKDATVLVDCQGSLGTRLHLFKKHDPVTRKVMESVDGH